MKAKERISAFISTLDNDSKTPLVFDETSAMIGGVETNGRSCYGNGSCTNHKGEAACGASNYVCTNESSCGTPNYDCKNGVIIPSNPCSMNPILSCGTITNPSTSCTP